MLEVEDVQLDDDDRHLDAGVLQQAFDLDDPIDIPSDQRQVDDVMGLERLLQVPRERVLFGPGIAPGHRGAEQQDFRARVGQGFALDEQARQRTPLGFVGDAADVEQPVGVGLRDPARDRRGEGQVRQDAADQHRPEEP